MFLIKKTRPNTRHTSFAIFASARQKTRPIAISRVLLANSDGPTDGPTDRPTRRLIVSRARD